MATAYDTLPEAVKSLFTLVTDHIASYKEVDGKLAAADGDRETAIKAYMDTSDDAQAAKMRTQIENLTAKLRELAEKNVQELTLSDEQKAALLAEKETHKEKIRSGRAVILKTSKLLEIKEEDVTKALDEIGDPTKGAKSPGAGKTGSNLPRVSVLSKAYGGNLPEDGEDYATFSALAKGIGMDVADLQKEFAKAAGVPHEDISSVDKPVAFTVKPHPNGSEYMIETRPKPRKPRNSDKAESVATDGPAEAPNFEDAANSAA